jgi:3D-(3,5/4)-trihydroxycyclohexane-1,2-dione acylhydrolase (decyclizing)
MGCAVFSVDSLGELEGAYRKAREVAVSERRPAVVVIRTHPSSWTEAGAWWEVGVPEVSHRAGIGQAREEVLEGKAKQVRYLG